MQLNITGCEDALDSEEFMKTILRYKSVWAYMAALMSFDEGGLLCSEIDVDLFGNTVSIQFEEKE